MLLLFLKHLLLVGLRERNLGLQRIGHPRGEGGGAQPQGSVARLRLNGAEVEQCRVVSGPRGE
jgi:hypothetical protein